LNKGCRFKTHWKFSGGVPEALTLKVTFDPLFAA